MNIKFWYFTLLREIGRIISKKITFSNRYHRILHILLLSRCICIYKNRRGNLALQLYKNVQYNTIFQRMIGWFRKYWCMYFLSLPSMLYGVASFKIHSYLWHVEIFFWYFNSSGNLHDVNNSFTLFNVWCRCSFCCAFLLLLERQQNK